MDPFTLFMSHIVISRRLALLSGFDAATGSDAATPGETLSEAVTMVTEKARVCSHALAAVPGECFKSSASFNTMVARGVPAPFAYYAATAPAWRALSKPMSDQVAQNARRLTN